MTLKWVELRFFLYQVGRTKKVNKQKRVKWVEIYPNSKIEFACIQLNKPFCSNNYIITVFITFEMALILINENERTKKSVNPGRHDPHLTIKKNRF